tara:strand:+ start:731 stop:1366 length:636 start_codon:yes stop_codon:yes gene_type:complete
MTLIEIVIASVLLSILAMMSLVSIQASGTQAHMTSNRADIYRRGNSTIVRLERELEGGSYTGQDNAVGTYNVGPQTVNFLAAGSAGCTAIQFDKITGYDAVANAQTTGATVIYAFEPADVADGDNDGLVSEFRLVRVSNGVKVTIQDNILATGQPGIPSGVAVASPTFLLTAPSNLQITFSLGTVVGFAGGQRTLTATTVTRNLNLRNLNQ